MKLFFCDISDFPKNVTELQNRLPESRRLRMAQYLRREDQLRCLGAGLLLAHCFGDAYDDRMSHNSYGKPLMKETGTFFNLSHSGDYVVLATADQEIGVDVQQHEEGDFAAMAKISFHPDEQNYLASCKNNQKEVFYSLWTLKESYMKAVGMGFSLPSASFSISLTEHGPRFDVENGYSLSSIPFHSGYSLAVCTKSSLENPLLQKVRWFG